MIFETQHYEKFNSFKLKNENIIQYSFNINTTDYYNIEKETNEKDKKTLIENLINFLNFFYLKDLKVESKYTKNSKYFFEISYELPCEYTLFVVKVIDDFIEKEGVMDYVEEKVQVCKITDKVYLKSDNLIISKNLTILVNEKDCYITVFSNIVRKQIKDSLDKVCNSKYLTYEIMNKSLLLNKLNNELNKQEYNSEINDLKADRSINVPYNNNSSYKNNYSKETSWRKVSNASTKDNIKSHTKPNINDYKSNFNRSRFYSEYSTDLSYNQTKQKNLLPKNNNSNIISINENANEEEVFRKNQSESK